MLADLPETVNGQDSEPLSRVESAVPDTGRIATGIFQLRYRIEGTGTPAIVIGFPAYYPRVFSKYLRSHLRFVFLDHRGTAPSP